MMLATTRTTIRHHVRVRHATTHRSVTPLAAQLEAPAPWWWSVRPVDGGVVVFAPDGRREPTAPLELTLRVTDPVTATMLSAPEARIRLTAAELVHEFQPVRQTVTVLVVDRQGTPRTGVTVRAVPTSGSPIALPAVAGSPGTYRSAQRTWLFADTPFELQVEGRPVDRFGVDPTRLDTRLHVVTPA
jgi:hypothetical protein